MLVLSAFQIKFGFESLFPANAFQEESFTLLFNNLQKDTFFSMNLIAISIVNMTQSR